MDEKSFQLSTINYAVLLKSMCWPIVFTGETHGLLRLPQTQIFRGTRICFCNNLLHNITSRKFAPIVNSTFLFLFSACLIVYCIMFANIFQHCNCSQKNRKINCQLP